MMKKVGYLIKREYDQIKVFNYIFVQFFFHPSFFLSFKRVLIRLYFFLINTGFSSVGKLKELRKLNDKKTSRQRLVR